jgi:hypothetical protein
MGQDGSAILIAFTCLSRDVVSTSGGEGLTLAHGSTPMAGTIELANSPTTLSSAHDEIFGPRTVLIAVAVLELLASLWDFLFGRMSILFRDPLELAEPGIGDVLAKLYLACHPLLALVALALAATGRIRRAVVVLGAIELVRWLKFMPSVMESGLRLDNIFDVQWTVAQIFLLPLIGALSITLALRNHRLKLATALTGIPSLYNLTGLTMSILWTLINGL